MTISAADKNLCDMRLTGSLIAKPPGDQEGQGRLAGMDADLQLQGIFDVKGFSVHTDSLSFGLTFNINGIDRGTLSEFAKRDGRLLIHGVEDIPESAEDDDDGESDE